MRVLDCMRIAVRPAFPAACLVALCTGCGPRAHMKVLINMIDQQEKFFREEVVPGFESRSRTEIEVIGLESIDRIAPGLDSAGQEVGLVKVPFGKSASLVRKGLIKPLDSFLTPEQLREFNDIYLLTSLGKTDGKQYYIPRKFETRIMVYRRSKLEEALGLWRELKDSIDRAVKEFNGYGLPATYLLEEDPNRWDFYDVFVAGWVWAHTAYDGRRTGRVAHRGKRYSGTSLRVIDRVFQCGGDSASVLSVQGDPVVDALHWEAVYAAGGIYNERMWKEGWSGMGVWEGFKQGEVFLSFMTQLDCFFIHGTGRDGLEGYLDNSDDMGVAVMPAGCSVELDGKGNVLRKGARSITTGGWWWGIPARTPDPLRSYRLARHITSAENQLQGCSRFGMVPVRKDILGDLSMMFGGGWITRVYEVSLRQLMHNGRTVVPSHPAFDDVSLLYLDMWYDIVVDRGWSPGGGAPDRSFIQAMVDGVYRRKLRKIMASG